MMTTTQPPAEYDGTDPTPAVVAALTELRIETVLIVRAYTGPKLPGDSPVVGTEIVAPTLDSMTDAAEHLIGQGWSVSVVSDTELFVAAPGADQHFAKDRTRTI